MELEIKLPDKIFIIAEIGINHNGFRNSKKADRYGKKCRCDAVKFQKRNIEIVYSKRARQE